MCGKFKEPGTQGYQSTPVSETVAALKDKYLREVRDEARHETRYSLWTNVKLWLDDSGESECVSTDVSESGLGLFCKRYVPPGTVVQMGFPSLEGRLMVAGVVRHSLYLDGNYHHIGIEFAES